MKKITVQQILEELYGVPLKQLEEYSKKCLERNVEWYLTLYWDNDNWDRFVKYLIDKYRLEPKRYWEAEISGILMSYSPTSVEKTCKEELKKLDKEMLELRHELQKKVWVG